LKAEKEQQEATARAQAEEEEGLAKVRKLKEDLELKK